MNFYGLDGKNSVEYLCHHNLTLKVMDKKTILSSLCLMAALLPAFPATGKSGLSETQIVIATTGRRLPVGDKKKAVCRI